MTLRAAGLAVALTLAATAPSAQPRPPAPPTAPAPAPLRFTWRAGRQVNYSLRTTQSMEGAAARSTRLEVEAALRVETLSVDSVGNAAQRLTVGSTAVRGDALPADARGRIDAALRSLRLEFRQDTRGAVTDRGAVAAGPEVRSTVAALVETLEQAWGELPLAPVRPGDGWESRRTLALGPGSGGLAIEVAVRTTLRSRTAVGAVFDQQMTLSSAERSSVAGTPARAEGSASAVVEVDLGEGRVVASSGRGSLNLGLQVRGRLLTLRTSFSHDLRADAPRGR